MRLNWSQTHPFERNNRHVCWLATGIQPSKLQWNHNSFSRYLVKNQSVMMMFKEKAGNHQSNHILMKMCELFGCQSDSERLWREGAAVLGLQCCQPVATTSSSVCCLLLTVNLRNGPGVGVEREEGSQLNYLLANKCCQTTLDVFWDYIRTNDLPLLLFTHSLFDCVQPKSAQTWFGKL